SPHDVRKRIGFLQENPPLYTEMPVQDYIKFAGELRGMDAATLKKRLGEVLEIADLNEVANDPIDTLSHGFRQRVGLAQAIIHNPKLLILDEPTRGLDPVQIVEMRNLIHDLKQNHTVLISSHILTEISQTCDRLLVIDRGRLVGEGTETELAKHEGEIGAITVTVHAPGEDPKGQIIKVLQAIAGVTKVSEPFEHGGGYTYALATNKDIRADVSRAIVEAKLDLLKLDYSRSELENTFIRLVGGAADAGN
ncbi:MAG TPA: ABC transporter ATP-binding protein, partial [Kofleriaceae bacterium]